MEPQECIYVGDGSSQELTGAAAIGMRPVLKRIDLRDVYDSHRPEVEGWRGLAINEIKELCDMRF
jgi:putative hydrolase of the HAD superfamily